MEPIIRGFTALALTAAGILGTQKVAFEPTEVPFEEPHNWTLTAHTEVPEPMKSVRIYSIKPQQAESFGDDRREPTAEFSWSEETTGGNIPEGLTLDPNWEAIMADPDRTTPYLPPYRDSSPDWRCDGWMNLARQAGWEEEELPKLSYTIYRESRCIPDRHNPDDPMGGSNGLMQINQFWCKPTRYWPTGWLQAQGVLGHCDELYDPETNLRAGLAIRNNSGWTPWGFRK